MSQSGSQLISGRPGESQASSDPSASGPAKGPASVQVASTKNAELPEHAPEHTEIPDEFIIAEIVGPHGIHGMVRAFPYTDFPEELSRLEEVVLEKGNVRQHFRLESAAVHGRMLLMKFAGIETPEAAADRRGFLVKIPRAEAVPLPEGHYYFSDIVGLEVLDAEGRSYGRVRQVFRTGSNDVYATATVLVPATREAVQEINLEQGFLRVNPNFVVQED